MRRARCGGKGRNEGRVRPVTELVGKGFEVGILVDKAGAVSGLGPI